MAAISIPKGYSFIVLKSPRSGYKGLMSLSFDKPLGSFQGILGSTSSCEALSIPAKDRLILPEAVILRGCFKSQRGLKIMPVVEP
jgi:hypothetical protein